MQVSEYFPSNSAVPVSKICQSTDEVQAMCGVWDLILDFLKAYEETTILDYPEDLIRCVGY